MKWQVHPERRLHARIWDDEAIVFDAASGDTHLLHADAATILDVLRHGPQDLVAILRLLDVQNDIDNRQDLQTALSQLTELALLECLPQ